ncbi:MAG: hypothetical protein ACFFDN_00395 [Candidatus Hodarchaeota archaeon]
MKLSEEEKEEREKMENKIVDFFLKNRQHYFNEYIATLKKKGIKIKG